MGALPMKWSIIVHGGAHTISADKVAPHKIGCLRAVDAGAALLEKGASALEAVEAAFSKMIPSSTPVTARC